MPVPDPQTLTITPGEPPFRERDPVATGGRTLALSPLVERVRAKILREFALGHHAISQPVPSHRAWARRLGVSSSTVQNAFEILKREGIVEARKGSYTFLRRLPSETPSGEETLGPKSRTRISLWLAAPRGLRWTRRALLRQRSTKQFLAQHPELAVDERLFDLRSGPMEGHVLSSFSRAAEPVVAQVRRTSLAQLFDQEALAPIDGDGSDKSYLEKIDPRWLQVCTVKNALRVLPTSVSCSFLFYNKHLFRQAGLDPDRPPRDWEEFLFAARALKAHQGERPSFHLVDDMQLVWWLMQLAYQAMPRQDLDAPVGGVSFLPPVDWLGDAARQALRFFIQLRFQEKLLGVWSESVLAGFSRCLKDQVPMMMGDSRLAAMVVQLNQAHRFGIAAMPSGPNGQTLGMLNCAGWILNAHAKTEEQQAGAKYIFARERFIHQGCGGTEMKALGVCPPLLPMLKEPSSDTFVVGPLPDDWAEALERLSATGRWEPEGADWKKETLASTAPSWLGTDPVPDPQHLQHSLALAEASEGWGETPTSALP